MKKVDVIGYSHDELSLFKELFIERFLLVKINGKISRRLREHGISPAVLWLIEEIDEAFEAPDGSDDSQVVWEGLTFINLLAQTKKIYGLSQFSDALGILCSKGFESQVKEILDRMSNWMKDSTQDLREVQTQKILRQNRIGRVMPLIDPEFINRAFSETVMIFRTIGLKPYFKVAIDSAYEGYFKI